MIINKRMTASILIIAILFAVISAFPLAANASAELNLFEGVSLYGASETDSSFTHTITGWDGIAAIPPQGNGTKEDPYLISSAANLKWMDSQTADGQQRVSTIDQYHKGEQIVTDDLSAIKPVYFKQICDIDLNGKSIRTIGGYIRWNWEKQAIEDNYFQFFCGEYDGQGYTIKNGSFVGGSSGSSAEERWPAGMFGCLYGGTVKDLTFDNITVMGNGVSGMIAGYAIALYNEEQELERANVIENITVKRNCRITTQNTDISLDMKYSAIGGLVAHAYNTTVKNCCVEVNIEPLKPTQFVGGVIGIAAHGTLVDRCIFKGAINYNNTISRETVIGGIVGDIRAYNSITYSATGITNCVNKGYFTGNVTNTGSSAFCLGGILGAICGVGTANIRSGTAYVCDNNYNMSDPTKWDHRNVNSHGRIGGILGGAWNSDNTQSENTYASFPITNCHTVPYPSLNTDASASAYTAGKVTGSIRKRTYLKVATETNCTQNASLLSDPAPIGLMSSILAEHALLGTQYKANENGTYTVRFISGINSLAYDKLTYTVGIDNGTETVYRQLEQQKVYTSFTTGSGDDLKIINASDYGFKYISVVTFSGLKKNTIYSFYFEPSAVRRSEESDKSLKSKGYTVTFDSTKSTPLFVKEDKRTDDVPLMINGNSIEKYQIAYSDSDPVGYYTARALQGYLKDAVGIELNVVSTNTSSSEYEIRIDHSNVGNLPVANAYKICLAGNSLELLYGSNASAATLMLEALKNIYMNVTEHNINICQSESDIIIYDRDMLSRPIVLPKTVSAQLVEKDSESDIRLMYQNIWGLSETAEKMDALLNVRKAVYLGYAPDIICLQEASATNHKTCDIIQWLLNNGYSMYRGNQGIINAGSTIRCTSWILGGNCPANQTNGVALPIFYKADRFTVNDSGYNQSPYAGDKGSSWVVLTDKLSNRQFAVFNSHFSADSNAGNNIVKGEIQRFYEAQQLISSIEHIKGTYDVPIFTGGDYNTSPDSSINGSVKTTTAYSDKYISFAAGDVICPYFVLASKTEHQNGNGSLTQIRNGISKGMATPYSPTGGTPVYDKDLKFFNIAEFKYLTIGKTIDYAMYDFSEASAEILRYHVCTDIYSSTSSDHKPHFVDFTLS